ncbi:MAG: class I SAM-dependent methyltransferase [Sphingomonadaceae bacterium]
MAGLKPHYDEAYYRSREGWPDFRREAESLLELARLSPDARVLELGCGGGELLARLERRARLAVGVDLSPEGLRLARLGGRASVLGARVESLPFRAGSFDAIVAQHLIEHLHYPLEAMREWHRVLRPGGVLALVTPNAAHPDPSLFYDPTHVSLFTRASLRSALEAAGFRATHLYTLFPYLGRGRLARAASIRLAPLALHLPALRGSGRSLVAAAVKEPQPSP